MSVDLIFDAQWVKLGEGEEDNPPMVRKESAENTIRNLAGFCVRADKVTGSKEVRAEPFGAQVQGDDVRLIGGDWVRDFLDEAEAKHKDQIDAAAGVF